MKTRGKGFKKEMWFSICSRHFIYDENCDLCKKGCWRNAYNYKLSSIFYKIFPRLWCWAVNRKIRTKI